MKAVIFIKNGFNPVYGMVTEGDHDFEKKQRFSLTVEVSHTEISQLKRAESEFQKAQKRYEDLLDKARGLKD